MERYFHRLTAILLILAFCLAAPDMDARRRKRHKRRKPVKTTRLVMKTPTKSGPLEDMEPFVTFERPNAITRGLDNRVIALWQSHGRYYDQKTDAWRWQRPRLFGTVEDLFSQGFVMPYLMPMLENAGAYVMSPRERDTNLTEIIADTDGSPEGDFYMRNGRHHWQESEPMMGFAMPKGHLTDGVNPFALGTSETCRTVGLKDVKRESTANWTATLPRAGRYAVYVSYRTMHNSAPDARYTVNHLGGTTHVTVNQRMGAGTWIYLGHYDLPKGKPRLPIVTLSNRSATKDAVVNADAVKIGGGMGNVARASKASGYHPTVSGAPRYTEGARYWLQWAGMPEKVYTESRGTNDYTDDYKARALWVNHLAGGSPMLPDSAGLGIPVDLAVAFHTDAGTKPDSVTVGTLGIFSTDDGNLLGDGRSRYDARDLANAIIDQVTSDIRRLHEPEWTYRGVKDGKYYEIRETKVPAMIIEALSHQNFTDMKYGLDPRFRFDVARAVYKGVLKFLARRYGKDYTVQPLAPSAFAIHARAKGRYVLTWSPTPDPLEPTAEPEFYQIQQRKGNGAFRTVATTRDPFWETDIAQGDIHSFRVVAGNDGGTSFPSEILAVYNNGAEAPDVNIVNGFTRVSAPDTFEGTDFSGFNFASDAGVADREDIITTGHQFNHRAASAYDSDAQPGFGASRGNLENMVKAGNTFDFVSLHGRAVKAAGRGFVSESVEAYVNEIAVTAPGTPGNPAATDLILGKQKEIAPGNGRMGTRYKAFPRGLQRRLTDYVGQGGSLLISGAYVAEDLFGNVFSDDSTRMSDAEFATSVLGYEWQPGCGPTDGKVMLVQSPFRPFGWNERLEFTVEAGPDCYAVEMPDALRPSDAKGSPIMRYVENGLAAGVATTRLAPGTVATSSRVVVLGFPFETIRGEKARNEVMEDVMKFLLPLKY